MDIEKSWEKALRETGIIRARVQALMTLGTTRVPYILLSESSVNYGDTVVRKGEVRVEKPSLIIPPNNPQFQGFEFEDAPDIGAGGGLNQNSLVNFLIVRGVTIPSLRYDNKTSTLDIYEGKLSSAIKHYQDLLQREENVDTGLVVGPEDCWQFSLIIFMCTQIARNLDQDIRRLLEEYHKRFKE
jgi:hypothetical protein